MRGPMTKQFRATMAAILAISTISLPAQTTTASKTTTTKKAAAKKAPAESPVEREIRELREQMQNQQAQIDALKRQNAEQDADSLQPSRRLRAPRAAASPHLPRLTASAPAFVQHRVRREPQQHRDRSQVHHCRHGPDHQRHQEDHHGPARVPFDPPLQGNRDYTCWLLRG